MLCNKTVKLFGLFRFEDRHGDVYGVDCLHRFKRRFFGPRRSLIHASEGFKPGCKGH